MRKKLTDQEIIKALKKAHKTLHKANIESTLDSQTYKENLQAEMKDKAVADLCIRQIRSLFVGADFARISDREIKILQYLARAGMIKMPIQEIGFLVKAPQSTQGVVNSAVKRIYMQNEDGQWMQKQPE